MVTEKAFTSVAKWFEAEDVTISKALLRLKSQKHQLIKDAGSRSASDGAWNRRKIKVAFPGHTKCNLHHFHANKKFGQTLDQSTLSEKLEVYKTVAGDEPYKPEVVMKVFASIMTQFVIEGSMLPYGFVDAAEQKSGRPGDSPFGKWGRDSRTADTDTPMADNARSSGIGGK